MERKLIAVILWIYFIGLILSCPVIEHQWLTIPNCPNFFPSYDGFKNMSAHSVYECVHNALKEPAVKALAFHTDSNSGLKTCYLYDNITASCNGSVHDDEDDHVSTKYLFKAFKCGNGGSLNEDKLSCSCPDGYFGRYCTDLATDCKDLQNRGIISYGKYSLNIISGRPPITVTCSQGLTRMMHHSNAPYYSFNRSWVEYRFGFGDNGHYWIGLEIIHYLTVARNHTILDISVKQHSESQTGLTIFTEFKVLGEDTEFLMTYKNYTNLRGVNVGDLIRTLNNTRFSTYDNDNDNMTINCAALKGGGWWYNREGIFERDDGTSFEFECAPASPTGYFWKQCDDCSRVKNFSTGMPPNAKVYSVSMWLK